MNKRFFSIVFLLKPLGQGVLKWLPSLAPILHKHISILQNLVLPFVFPSHQCIVNSPLQHPFLVLCIDIYASHACLNKQTNGLTHKLTSRHYEVLNYASNLSLISSVSTTMFLEVSLYIYTAYIIIYLHPILKHLPMFW